MKTRLAPLVKCRYASVLSAVRGSILAEPSSAVPPRAARKPKGEGHERRAEILTAAERLFVDVGYEGATIRRIADEVGLSSTALYMHFRDKSEILAEICREGFMRLTAACAGMFEQDEPVQVRLRRMLEAYAAFAFDNPNAFRLIQMTRPEEARMGVETMAREVGIELYRIFEAAVSEAQRQALLRHDPKVTAQALWAGAHGVASLMITKPYFDWAAREVLLDATLDALFEGLFRT